MAEGSNDRFALARREFLKTTGAVVVGLSVADSDGAQAPTGEVPAPLRGVVSGPPDPAQVDSYIAIHPDNTATIFAGYVELGQGGPTALRQVAAEELDLDLDQVKDVRIDTFVSTNGFTAASRTAGIGGTELRAAAAEARRILLELASERLKAPSGDLIVTKGVVSVRRDPQRSVTYADLLGAKPFNRKYEPVSYTGGIELPRKGLDNAIPKRRDDYRIVGTRVMRPDIAEKVKGTYEYVQHVRLPGMLHGRVVWPRGQGALGVSNPTVVGIDEASIKGIPGVQIVRRRNFVGVVAPREWDAVRAARQLKVTWEPFAQALPGHEGVFDSFRSAKTTDATDTNTGDVEAALSRGAHVLSATYRGPYQSHGTMAPNCAVADVSKDAALVMCSDQGIYQTRNGLARVLGLPIEKIRVQYYAGSNTYGSSCYRDAAQAAAILSQEVGKPVRLQFSREDEFGWDNYGPGHLADLRAAVDAHGKLVAYRVQGVGPLSRRDGYRHAVGPGNSVCRGRRRLWRALPGAPVADRHVRCPEPAHRQPPPRWAGLSENGRVARADGSVGVLRAGRDDGRAGPRSQAGSLRVPQAEHLAPAVARRLEGGDRPSEVDAARGGLESLFGQARQRARHWTGHAPPAAEPG